MTFSDKLFKFLILSVVLTMATSSAWANIWVDETFDDGLAFDASALDTFSYDTLDNPLILSASGTITSDRSYNGLYSYRLDPGEAVSISEPFTTQTNKPQYFQFAVSVDVIPATDGTVAVYTWDWTINSIPHTFFVELWADGEQILIGVGEMNYLGAFDILGTLDDVNTWKYITVEIAEDGASFYSSSLTPQFTIPWTADPSALSHQWSLQAFESSVYIDDMYWEGYMEGEAERNLRPFGPTASSPTPTSTPEPTITATPTPQSLLLLHGVIQYWPWAMRIVWKFPLAVVFNSPSSGLIIVAST